MIRTPDGRELAVETRGHPLGRPVFLLHGTPGSRHGPAPRSTVLYRMGVRLITFDRPGYGDSDRRPGRRVVDAADDVAAIADALGIGEFAVMGRSGGAPHALGCAARLPDRTARAVALVPLAPRDADGLDWFEGMTEDNVRAYTIAAGGPEAVSAELTVRAEAIRADPKATVAAMHGMVPDPDRGVLADAAIRALLVRNFAEGLRTSTGGWVDDVLALSSPWQFRPEDIRVPVLLWHGAQDVFAPALHTRWLAQRIPGAHCEVPWDAAHFGALEVFTRALRWARW
ncbi:alpha/beta fold hydrolase [Streptomyces sp. NPDC020719]|uniref:alpha/beta fold hydrolase n=1 Tax=Streptomyces sp. NPDC020719 TaxID=3154896 RepID=UPI0033CA03A2